MTRTGFGTVAAAQRGMPPQWRIRAVAPPPPSGPEGVGDTRRHAGTATTILLGGTQALSGTGERRRKRHRTPRVAVPAP